MKMSRNTAPEFQNTHFKRKRSIWCVLETNVRQLQAFDADKNKKGTFAWMQSFSFQNGWPHIGPEATRGGYRPPPPPLGTPCTLLLVVASMMSRAGIISEWFLEHDRQLVALVCSRHISRSASQMCSQQLCEAALSSAPLSKPRARLSQPSGVVFPVPETTASCSGRLGSTQRNHSPHLLICRCTLTSAIMNFWAI